MVIQTNILAMNAGRQFGITTLDRTSIQAEIDELTDEINHVGDGTTSNSGCCGT